MPIIPAGSVGYDWSFAGRAVDPAKVKASGATFVVRYLSHDPTKDITPAERDAIAAAGLTLLLVVELASTTSLGGASAGDALGAEMVARAQALGYDGPLIFAHDTGTRDPVQLAAASDFFRAVWAHTIPAGYGRAVYGPGFFLQDCDQMAPTFGPLDLAWQAAPQAWDSGVTYPGAHIVQQLDAGPGANGAFGGSVDRNLCARDVTIGEHMTTKLVHIANDYNIYAVDGVHASHVSGDAYSDFVALFGAPTVVSPAFLACLRLINPQGMAPKDANYLTDASSFAQVPPSAPISVNAAPVDLTGVTSRLDAIDAAVRAPRSLNGVMS